MGREKPKLVVLGGPMDGLEFSVDQPVMTIGRRDDQDVCLRLDQAVSRHHARLSVEEGEYWLEDDGSTYGTFIADGEHKIEDRVKITPGDTFRLGAQSTLKLVLEDVESKIVRQADHLMRRLAVRLPEVPQEKWTMLKEQLAAILRRLDEVSSEEELVVLLQQMATIIEEALGVHVVVGRQPGSGEPCGVSPDAADLSPEEGGLGTLVTFFKSNLSEIIKKMEAEEAEGAKP